MPVCLCVNAGVNEGENVSMEGLGGCDDDDVCDGGGGVVGEEGAASSILGHVHEPYGKAHTRMRKRCQAKD